VRLSPNETKTQDKPTIGLRVFCESHRLISPRILSPALLDGQAAICSGGIKKRKHCHSDRSGGIKFKLWTKISTLWRNLTP